MKILHLALASLALPVVLAAQAAPATPPANPITTAFKNRILASHRNIAQAFDSIPASMFDFKPTPAQLSIGYVAQHVASDNYFFCNKFGEKQATVDEKESTTADSVKAKWPKDELVARLKASFAFCADAIGQLDDTRLGDAVTITFGGNSRQSTKASMVLGHALDLADHYSQIANYMRLNKLIPPTALPRPPRP